MIRNAFFVSWTRAGVPSSSRCPSVRCLPAGVVAQGCRHQADEWRNVRRRGDIQRRRTFTTTSTSTDSRGPITHAYLQRVTSGKIRHDAEQLAVAERLDALHLALMSSHQTYRAPPSLQAITDVKPRQAWKRLTWGWQQWLHAQQQQRPRGLYLYGSVGVGKSFLMDLFYEITTTHQSPCFSHRRAHFHEFMLDVHQRVHDAKQQSPRQDVVPMVAWQLAAEAQLLCFDELAIADIADAMIISRLFGIMWKAGVVVVATSNRAPTHLYEGGINRSRFLPFIDLLQDRMDVVHMTGQQDYRRLEETLPYSKDAASPPHSCETRDISLSPPYYFSPHDAPSTRLALQEIFDEAAAQHGSQPESVPVRMGRTVHVTRAAGPTAWLDFDQLCAQPLGAADYLALCQRFEVLLVDHVPQLDANTFNEARRFVTLIDAVYETQVHLVLATAVPVDRLFVHFDAHVETNDGDEEIALAQSSESVVTDQGGASSSHATTLIQNQDGTQVEWSATGRIGVSLAQLSAVRDVAFSFARAESRLAEMSRPSWGRTS